MRVPRSASSASTSPGRWAWTSCTPPTASCASRPRPCSTQSRRDRPDAVFRRRSRVALKRRFDEEHLRRYGTCAPEENAEIVSLRASVTGAMKKPSLERIARGGRAPLSSANRGKRKVYFAELGRSLATQSYARESLRAGNRIEGPALVEEHASTTVVLPGDRLEVDAFGNLVIEVGRRTK